MGERERGQFGECDMGGSGALGDLSLRLKNGFVRDYGRALSDDTNSLREPGGRGRPPLQDHPDW